MSKLTIIQPYTDFVQILPGGKGLSIDDKMPFECYEQAIAAFTGAVVDGLWLLGDLFAFGPRVYGEAYAQAIDDTKYSEKTVSISSWVCSTFPPSRRHKSLTFNHHKIVAGLEPDDREKLLFEAEKDNMSTRELGRIKKERFPSTRGIKKKPEEENNRMQENKAERVTQTELHVALDVAVSFFEQCDPKVAFLEGFSQKTNSKLLSLKKNARRLGFLRGN